MKVVVPLAGPDFELADGRVKAELTVQGQCLLRLALETRPWWIKRSVRESDLTFVLRTTPASRRFAMGRLKIWYPSAGVVFLDAPTRGAALSTLAGVSLIAHCNEALCVDLADMIYDLDFDSKLAFEGSSAKGIGIVFDSSSPVYSYFQTDNSGRVTAIAEKRVISNNASVGTYLFASAGMFLRGLACNLANPNAVTVRSLFYVCPTMQGLLDEGMMIELVKASNVRDATNLFRSMDT